MSLYSYDSRYYRSSQNFKYLYCSRCAFPCVLGRRGVAPLRILMIEGRVEGAYKTGKIWLIPLFNGKPIIKRKNRGPAPRWSNPRVPAKTIVHVNKNKIQSNKKNQEHKAVITVKKRTSNQYAHEVEIPGGCRVVYRPDHPKGYGAEVWIESFYDVIIVA